MKIKHPAHREIGHDDELPSSSAIVSAPEFVCDQLRAPEFVCDQLRSRRDIAHGEK
jgi:hypothetical protein